MIQMLLPADISIASLGFQGGDPIFLRVLLMHWRSLKARIKGKHRYFRTREEVSSGHFTQVASEVFDQCVARIL